jgi:HlyD family secretion protein
VRKYSIVIGISLIAAAAGYLYYKQQDHYPKNEIHLQGNVDIRDVDLGFRVKGRLETMLHDEGDWVKKGDKLATLDPKPFDIEVANQNAQVAQALANLQKLKTGNRPQEIQQAMALVREKEAAYTNAKRSLERQADLVKRNLASKQTYDDALTQSKETEAQLNTAKEALALSNEGFRIEDIAAGLAQLDAAKARLSTAEINLHDTELLAPSEGTILTRIREPGSIIEAGNPVFTLSLTNPIQVRAYIRETDLGRVKPGDKVLIYTDSDPSKPLEGQVGFISPQAEFTPKNIETKDLRTDLVYRIRIIVNDKNGILKQGMPVDIVINLLPQKLPNTQKNLNVINN